MRIKLILLSLLVFSANILFAQKENFNVCGTTEVSPWLEHYLANKDLYNSDIPEAPIYIPLTVHILGDDEGNGYYTKSQIMPALCRLNEDFAPSNIQFFVEDDFNYINNTSWYDHENFGSGVEMMRQNNIARTINCYIVRNPAGNCGYYAPGGDAVALNKGCLSPNDHTWAHELGHFLSLPHTFVGWEGVVYDPSVPTSVYAAQNRRGIENVNGTNCRSTADRFCDTPPDYLSYRWPCDGQGKSIVVMTDRNGEEFRSDGTLFMSYSNDNCSSRFSLEEIQAMVANLNSVRSGLLSKEPFEGEVVDKPELLDPALGTAIEFQGSRLTWSKVENATLYFVQVSRLPNLGGLYIVDDFVKDTFIDLPKMDIGRTYYWRVQAFNRFSYCSNRTERSNFLSAALTSTSNVESDILDVWPNPLSLSVNNELFVSAPWILQDKEFNWSLVSIDGSIVSSGKGIGGTALKFDQLETRGVYNLVIHTSDRSVIRQIIIQ
jgi:hypothetical protein